MNKVFLKGRLTADPEIRKTANDISVCNFSIAVNRRFDREKTDFINCEAWRQTAEFISKYFTKGKEIVVCGELHIDKWEKDGETKYLTKISVDEVEFCGGKSDTKPSIDVNPEQNSPSYSTTAASSDFTEIGSDDDLPF